MGDTIILYFTAYLICSYIIVIIQKLGATARNKFQFLILHPLILVASYLKIKYIFFEIVIW